MTFDVTAAIAERRRRYELEQRAANAALMIEEWLERGLLFALLVDSALDNEQAHPYPRVRVIPLCDDVEADDFGDLRYRAAFSALRNLQARGEPCGPFEISEEIAHTDKVRERHTAQVVSLDWLMGIVLAENTMTVTWLRAAKKRLRELAQIRRLV